MVLLGGTTQSYTVNINGTVMATAATKAAISVLAGETASITVGLGANVSGFTGINSAGLTSVSNNGSITANHATNGAITETGSGDYSIANTGTISNLNLIGCRSPSPTVQCPSTT